MHCVLCRATVREKGTLCKGQREKQVEKENEKKNGEIVKLVPNVPIGEKLILR